MAQPKGSNGPTIRTHREHALLELIDATDDHIVVAQALDAIERAVAHARRRLGAANKRVAGAYDHSATAQAREDDGPAPTPLAQVIQFPTRRRPVPPLTPIAVAA